MAGFGGFYKGEKKKSKKQIRNKGASQAFSSAPTFTLPQLIGRKKNV